MRCMSKCVVARSMRVYTVLLFGITFGFALSTLLQSISYSDFGLKSGFLGGPADYPSLQGGKVSFSNLDTRAGELVEQIDIGGYYDYERLVLRDELEREERGGGEEGREEHDRERDLEEVKALEAPGDERVLDNKMKQREYVNNAWQGRNVRETINGKPITRLSDELAPRTTLLIGVVTSVVQLMSQTLAIQGTWGQDAAHVIYFTGEVQSLPHLPHGMVVVQLEGLDNKHAGWDLKELSVISYISTHYLDNTDWFLIVGDDTYVSPASLETELSKYDASMSVYLGRPLEAQEEGKEEEEGRERKEGEEEKGEGEEGKGEEGGADKLCNSASGVVYSRGFLEQLKPYLPVCWPGNGGELRSLSGCISVMGLKCTSAKQVNFTRVLSLLHMCL